MRFKTDLRPLGTFLLALALVACSGETDHSATDPGSRSSLQNAATLANGTTPGTLVIDPPTLIALGFAWYITGDDNRDCTVKVEYALHGGADWKRAMDLFRPESRSFTWGGVGPENLLAGSIIDLTPDTAYDVRFTLHDPDNAVDATQTLTNIRTRKVPTASTSGRAITVTTSSGLQAAADNAQPGDVITIKAGTYTGAFAFKVDGTEDAPVVFRGENRDTVIFDATDNTGWTFNFSEPFDVNDNSVTTGRRFNFLENLTLIHAKKSVRAALTTGMVLRNTVMKDFPVGATGNKTLGPYFADATNGYICDNALLGPQPTLYRDANDYGPSYNIELGGTGNVICNNVMTHWWDAITSTDHCYGTRNCLANDIYNNLIMYSTDDAMELDGMTRNVRALRNRLGSNYNGISTQPVYGGPIYLIRNEIFSNQAGAFKFNPLGGQDGPSGVVAHHNSVANYDRGIRGQTWSNFLFRNNILYATTGHAVYGSIQDEVDRGFDFDYNSLRPGTGGYPFKMTYLTPDPDVTVTYTTVGPASPICAGTLKGECHGTLFSSRTAEWVNVPEPTIGAGASTVSFTPDQWDFTLTSGAVSLDSGVVIPNVNDGYLGTAPDRGALERGQALPIYGPRPSGGPTPIPPTPIPPTPIPPTPIPPTPIPPTPIPPTPIPPTPIPPTPVPPTPIPGNSPPTVSLTTATGSYGSVTFNASASDPDGILSCTLNFGDGAAAVNCGTGIAHTYAPGTFSACARATDNQGASNQSCKSIQVSRRLKIRIRTLGTSPTHALTDPLLTGADQVGIQIDALSDGAPDPNAMLTLNSGAAEAKSQVVTQLHPGDSILISVVSVNETLDAELRVESDGSITYVSGTDPSLVEILGPSNAKLSSENPLSVSGGCGAVDGEGSGALWLLLASALPLIRRRRFRV